MKKSTGKGNAGGKESTWEERVERCGEVRWRRDMDFGRGSAGENEKYGIIIETIMLFLI